MNVLVSQSFEMAIDLLLKSTVVLTLASLACLFLRRSSAAVRSFVWTASMVCLLGITVVGFAPAVLHVPLLPSLASSHSAAVLQASESVASQPESIPGEPESVQPVVSRPATESTFASGSLALVLWLMWFSGAAWHMTRWLWGLRQLRRLAQQGSAPLPAHRHVAMDGAMWPEGQALREAARRCQLITSPEVRTPMSWGWPRPTTLVPPSFHSWPQSRQVAALCHELAHVQRRDWCASVVSQLAMSLYWFHPLLWLARQRLRLEQEKACDDLVLQSGVHRLKYARQLLEVARDARNVAFTGVAFRMAVPRDLDSRLFAILDENRNRQPTRLSTRLAVVLLSVLGIGAIGLADTWARSLHADISLATRQPVQARWAEAGQTGAVFLNGYVTFEKRGDEVFPTHLDGTFLLSHVDDRGILRTLHLRSRPGHTLRIYWTQQGQAFAFDQNGRYWLASVLPRSAERLARAQSVRVTGLELPPVDARLSGSTLTGPNGRTTDPGTGVVLARWEDSPPVASYGVFLRGVSGVDAAAGALPEVRPDSWFVLWSEGTDSRLLEVVAPAGSPPRVGYVVGGRAMPLDEAAEDWLRHTLPSVAEVLRWAQ